MKVDFLIIGAGRSGTTTIFQYLEQHKQVCFSRIKEIHYFSIDELYNRTENYYHSFFDSTIHTKIYVSADTYLFITEKAIKRIFDYNPKIKILIMLRNPVERTFSGYNYAINNGYLKKDTSFLQSIENEQDILEKTSSIEEKNNLCNAYQSLYHFHIKRWLEIFPKENFIFLKTKNLKNNSSQLLSELSSFLEIDAFETLQNIKANEAKSVKSKKLQQLLLNRNLPIRKISRKILPNFIKNKILNSSLTDKLYRMNKTENQVLTLSNEDKIIAQKHFAEDLIKLKNDFNITL
jgi:Sulfotransferase domain